MIYNSLIYQYFSPKRGSGQPSNLAQTDSSHSTDDEVSSHGTENCQRISDPRHYSLIGSRLTNRKMTSPQSSSHTKRRAWNTNSSESRGMITPIKIFGCASNYQEMSSLSPSSSSDWWHSTSNKSQRSIDFKVTATRRAIY